VFRFINSHSTTIITKPRPIAIATRSLFRHNRQAPSLIFQRRWASEDAQQANELAAEEPAAPETETSSSGHQAQDNYFQPAVDTQSAPTPLEDQYGPQSGREGNRQMWRRSPPAAPKETIYIGNLFFDVTAEDLKNELQRFGPVASTRIVYDSRGLSRG
jgi:RNA recognition motif-containing protein